MDNLNLILIINPKKHYKHYKTSVQFIQKIIVILYKKKLKIVNFYHINYNFHYIYFLSLRLL